MGVLAAGAWYVWNEETPTLPNAPQQPSRASGPPDRSSDIAQPLTEKDVQALYYNVCPPHSAGGTFENENSSDLSDTVVVVNGLSSLGGRVAHALSATNQWRVVSMSSLRDRSCGDKLLWHRQDVLRAKGVPSLFVDWSDSTAVERILSAHHHPRHIVYVPPSVDGESSVFSLDSAMWAAALHEFIALLEAVKNVSPTSRLTLVSVSKSVKNELEIVRPSKKHIDFLEALVGAFELSLSTYHTLYQIPFSVLRVQGFYGPWSHTGLSAISHEDPTNHDIHLGCYIDDVVRAIRASLSLNSKCTVLDLGSCEKNGNEYWKYAWEKLGMHENQLTDSDKGMKQTVKWGETYNVKRGKGVKLILTSYFSGTGFHRAPNKFKYLQSWLESVSDHRLNAVVLHNGLDKDFIARTQQKYSKLRFELVSLPHDFGQNSTCIQSVRAFANFLEHHADVERVVAMDLSKTIKRNVFPAMAALGDWLYSDVDLVPFRDILNHNCTSTRNSETSRSVDLASSMVLGGSRYLVLATLNKMTQCLEAEGVSNYASTLRCVMDRQFVQHAFLGWPFSHSIGQNQ